MVILVWDQGFYILLYKKPAFESPPQVQIYHSVNPCLPIGEGGGGVEILEKS